LKAFIGNEVDHVINQVRTLGVFPMTLQRMATLMTQNYKGHVTIIPRLQMQDYKGLLINPSKEEYEQAFKASYNSTL